MVIEKQKWLCLAGYVLRWSSGDSACAHFIGR